jgi:hypothetical protein
MTTDEIEKCWREIIADKNLVEDRHQIDPRRGDEFRRGWKASNQRDYKPETLNKLHWNNLGYRFGKCFGPRDDDEIKQVCEYLAKNHDGTIA